MEDGSNMMRKKTMNHLETENMERHIDILCSMLTYGIIVKPNYKSKSIRKQVFSLKAMWIGKWKFTLENLCHSLTQCLLIKKQMKYTKVFAF